MVRSGLKRLLEEDPALVVIAEATDGNAAWTPMTPARPMWC
jgi:DNA-binding NarL/FixJ family response regulator